MPSLLDFLGASSAPGGLLGSFGGAGPQSDEEKQRIAAMWRNAMLGAPGPQRDPINFPAQAPQGPPAGYTPPPAPSGQAPVFLPPAMMPSTAGVQQDPFSRVLPGMTAQGPQGPPPGAMAVSLTPDAAAPAPTATAAAAQPSFGKRLGDYLGNNSAMLMALGGGIAAHGMGGFANAAQIQAAMQPKWGIIGKDILGIEQYGWINPATQTVTPAGATPGAGASGALASGINPNKPIYGQLPKAQQGIIDTMLNGTLAPPSAMALKSQYWNTLLAAADEKAKEQGQPGFDATVWSQKKRAADDLSPQGKSGQTISALDTVQGHIEKLSNTIEDLAKHGGQSGWPALNRAMNVIASETPLTPERAKALASFNNARKVVVDEMSKAYKGGHLSDAEIRDWSALFQAADSPLKLRQTVTDFTEFLNTKRNQLIGQYAGLGVPFKGANAAQNERVTKLVHDRNAGEFVAAPAAAAPAAAATAPRAPAIGEVQKGYRFKGGNPADQNSWGKSVMPGPWEDYAPQQQAQGPWSDYAQPVQPSTGLDVAKSIPGGIAKLASGTAGLPGDIRELMAAGINKGSALIGHEIPATAASSVLSHIPLLDTPTSQQLQSGIESIAGGKFYEPQTTAGKFTQRALEFTPAVLGGPEAMAAKLATRVALPAAAATGVEQMGGGPLAQTAAAIASPAVLGAARRIVTPFPFRDAERAAAVQNLQQEGIPLTAGAQTGSRPLQYLEQSLGDIPGAGAASTRANTAAAEGITSAALRRANVDARRATPDVIDNAYARMGNQFEGLASRNELHVDPQLGHDMQAAVGDYHNLVSAPNRAPAIENFQQEIRNALQSHGGVMPGEVFQSITSRMDKIARGAPPDVAIAVRGMRSALNDAMERSIALHNPADLGGWRAVRNDYRNMLVIQRAANGPGSNAALGLISPSALRNATVALHGQRAYARGQGDFAGLARSGEAVMKELPQSGTAPRAYAMHLPGAIAGAFAGGGIGSLLGLAAAPIAGRTLMSRPAQAYLANQLLQGTRTLLRDRAMRAAILARQGGILGPIGSDNTERP